MPNKPEKIATSSTSEDHHELEEENSKSSTFINLLQKPFDFVNMMFQFLIYFMVKMATEGCMLPIPELDGNEREDHEDEDENDENRKEK